MDTNVKRKLQKNFGNLYQNGYQALLTSMYGIDVPALARDLNEAVGWELDDRRKTAGLSQQAVADRTGLGIATVKRYLAGKRGIPINALEVIADVIGADPTDVVANAKHRVKK